MLNNQLTDFSFAPTDDGRPVANAVQGGKRPRSSMAPVIVLDHASHFVAALGSPGGSAILEYNAKTLVGLLAWKLSLKQAIELPNLIARGDTFSRRARPVHARACSRACASAASMLKAGHAENSGLHGDPAPRRRHLRGRGRLAPRGRGAHAAAAAEGAEARRARADA